MSGFNMQPNNNSSIPSAVDPVCGMKVDANQPPYRLIYQGKEVSCLSVSRKNIQVPNKKSTRLVLPGIL
jgi:hypothetical protein